MIIKTIQPKQALWSLLAGMLLCACSTSSYMNIDYRLPAKSAALENQRMAVDVSRAFPTDAIFGERAQAEFKDFTGLFSFSVVQGGDKPQLRGALDLAALFREAFKERLSNMGVQVLAEPHAADPELKVLLKEFNLDLVGRTWLARISYEARLIQNQMVVAKQTISGTAERYKIVGHGDAETVMAELFSDSVNKLDLYGLIQQAGMSTN